MHRNRLWLSVAIWALINHHVLGGDGSIRQASATASEPAKELVEYREFEVRVDNKPMGTHCLTIKSNDEKHEVEMKTDVKADFYVYAYVFKFRGKEVWRDGQCVLADIRIEDGGKKRDFYFKTDGKSQQVLFNGKPMPADSIGRMTTAYWMLPELSEEEERRQKPFPVLDVDSGNTRNGNLKFVAESMQVCAGRSIPCKLYKMEGVSPADLWFDSTNRLVRQKSIEQGHATELRLKKLETGVPGK